MRSWYPRSRVRTGVGYLYYLREVHFFNVPKDKKRPLLKGDKMIDKRTKVGKAALAASQNMKPRELAAKAALARFGRGSEGESSRSRPTDTSTATAAPPAVTFTDGICIERSSDDEEGLVVAAKKKKGSRNDDSNHSDEDDDSIAPHSQGCGCRSCDWSKLFFVPSGDDKSIGV